MLYLSLVVKVPYYKESTDKSTITRNDGWMTLLNLQHSSISGLSPLFQTRERENTGTTSPVRAKRATSSARASLGARAMLGARARERRGPMG